MVWPTGGNVVQHLQSFSLLLSYTAELNLLFEDVLTQLLSISTYYYYLLLVPILLICLLIHRFLNETETMC